MQVDALGSERTVSLDDWALIVDRELNENRGNMTFLADIASYDLSHLIVTCKV